MRPRPVVLIIIDGLTPSMLEATDAPALRFLLEHGSYRRSVSTFPSLTPVCLASIATGGHGDKHGIPHLVWWNRDEERLVEYGSSFAALRASGVVQGVRDSVVNLNERHLLKSAETMFESLEGAGLTTAAINITTYRGRNRHISPIPGFPPVHGPKRFFYYSLYESDKTGARIAFLNRSLGSIDAYAATIGKWLVTRDGFDLLVHYLPDYDYASHALGPDAAHEALRRADTSIASLFEAAGGPDAFLARYGVVLCSDHGQSQVVQAARLDVPGALVTASNRAAMLYGADPRRLAEALDGEPSVDVALFLEDGEVVARSHGDDDLESARPLPGRPWPCRGRPPESELGRSARVCGPGLRVRRSGRAPPCRRRQPRCARRRRLGGTHAHRRARRTARLDHRHQGPPPGALRSGSSRSRCMSVGSTELTAEVPALPVPELEVCVGSTELTAEVPALPVPEREVCVGSTELEAVPA